jgi:hypothetical protein
MICPLRRGKHAIVATLYDFGEAGVELYDRVAARELGAAKILERSFFLGGMVKDQR